MSGSAFPLVSGPELTPRVYVVVPVHNRWDLTCRCLDSLRAQTHPFISVVVVDDGSTDETASELQSMYPEVAVIPGDGSLWWTGATNVGVGHVLGCCSESDYVLTLNNDTEVRGDYVARLLEAVGLSDGPHLIGSVAVDLRDWDTIVDGGPYAEWLTGATGFFGEGLRLSERGPEQPRLLPVVFLSGRGALVPVGVYRALGLYREDKLPHYGADYEFSRRAAKAGYRLLVDYCSLVGSHVDQTGIRPDQATLSWRQFVAMFFSRRSPNCLLYRWRFDLLVAPRYIAPWFMLMDSARVLLGALRTQLERTPRKRDYPA